MLDLGVTEIGVGGDKELEWELVGRDDSFSFGLCISIDSYISVALIGQINVLH